MSPGGTAPATAPGEGGLTGSQAGSREELDPEVKP
jgi:hypothetical protein